MEHGLINYAETKVFLLADESVFYSRWGGGGWRKICARHRNCCKKSLMVKDHFQLLTCIVTEERDHDRILGKEMGHFVRTCNIKSCFKIQYRHHSVSCACCVGLGTEYRSEKIPRNRLGMVSVIPRKKVLIPRHSEFRGRAYSEARKSERNLHAQPL
jgi:hypothetical protein